MIGEVEPAAGTPSDVTADPMWGDPYEVRRNLYARVPIPTVAFSADGAAAMLTGPLDVGFRVGDLVVAEPVDATGVFIQLESVEVVERNPVELDLSEMELAASTVAVHSRPILRAIDATGRVIATLGDGGPAIGPGRAFHESPVRAATPDEAAQVRAAVAGAGGAIVGTAIDGTGLEVSLRPTGFARHTFLCGQSGSGKTYTTGVVLEALRLATELPIIILDPNSDYVRLGELADGGDDALHDAYRALPDAPVVARSRGLGSTLELTAHFSDLSVEIAAAVLGLDSVGDLDEYALLRQAWRALDRPFAVGDVAAWAQTQDAVGARLATRIDAVGIGDWGLWCRPGETSITSSRLLRRQCTVIDLGSLHDPVERSLVSTVVLTTLWANRAERRSQLIVADEAHNIFPAQPTSRLAQVSRDTGTLIAAEGRKFGLHLLVATQRPGKVAEQVISQCDNLMLLRVNSRRDVEELCAIFSHVASGLIERSPSLSLGQVLYAGPIAPIPVYAQTRRRLTVEGGTDLPTTWATRTEPGT